MERPERVSPEAVWDEDEKQWVLARTDLEGRRQGRVIGWRADGTKSCEAEHLDGQKHGPFRRFHENGEVSRQGWFERGLLHGTVVFWRCTTLSSEPFEPGLGPEVWSVQVDYERGLRRATRSYDRRGQRVRADGSPLPTERPSSVPRTAHFYQENQREWWVDGLLRNNGNGTSHRLGVWRFWDPSGVLVAEHRYLDGVLDGEEHAFDPLSGGRVRTTTWRAGTRHGPELRFDPTGRLLSRIHYVHGEPAGATRRELAPSWDAGYRTVADRSAPLEGEDSNEPLAETQRSP